MAVLSKGSLIDPELVNAMFSGVVGHSTLAKLSASKPIPFSGEKVFVFSLDKEADIVAENGKKTAGGASVSPVNCTPIKFEYSARVSDEFMRATEEKQLDTLEQFLEGAKKKFARAIDLAAFHGVNPRTGSASAVVGDNNFDAKITNTVDFAAATADDNLDAAIAMVTGAERSVNGIALSPTFGSAMSKIKANGIPQYPEFRFGQTPTNFAGMGIDVNTTVSGASSKDHAIVGNFADMVRWGYAQEMYLDIIEYGNPDNDEEAGDLKGHNQILLRTEAYIGWGILDAASFARVVEPASSGE